MYTRGSLASIRVKKDIAELGTAILAAEDADADLQQASASVEFPDGQRNLLKLHIKLKLRAGVYQGGSFTFCVDVPSNYPFSPPAVRSLDRIWHPNIDPQSGLVSLPVLREDWRPVLGISTVVLALQLMLLDPDGGGGGALGQEGGGGESRSGMGTGTGLVRSGFEEQVRQTLRGNRTDTVVPGGEGNGFVCSSVSSAGRVKGHDGSMAYIGSSARGIRSGGGGGGEIFGERVFASVAAKRKRDAAAAGGGGGGGGGGGSYVCEMDGDGSEMDVELHENLEAMRIKEREEYNNREALRAASALDFHEWDGSTNQVVGRGPPDSTAGGRGVLASATQGDEKRYRRTSGEFAY